MHTAEQQLGVEGFMRSYTVLMGVDRDDHFAISPRATPATWNGSLRVAPNRLFSAGGAIALRLELR